MLKRLVASKNTVLKFVSHTVPRTGGGAKATRLGTPRVGIVIYGHLV